MKRRAKADGVPPHLLTFRAEDWPARTVVDCIRLWREARLIWHEQHGWPGGPLDLLRGVSDTKRRIEGRPLLSWGRTWDELERARHRPHKTSTSNERK